MSSVIIKTNMGAITLELDAQAAPKTVENFLKYCNSGFYNNTIFHRVIDRFMIQGGGLNSDLSSKTTNKPIQNEAKTGLKNLIGTVAMARTSDPHSATAQFFINVANNDFLNFRSETTDGWGYCAFAKVIDGMDIVRKISQLKTGNRGVHQDVPETDVIINSVEVIPSSERAEATITE